MLASGSKWKYLQDIAVVGLHVPPGFNMVVTAKLEGNGKGQSGALEGYTGSLADAGEIAEPLSGWWRSEESGNHWETANFAETECSQC